IAARRARAAQERLERTAAVGRRADERLAACLEPRAGPTHGDRLGDRSPARDDRGGAARVELSAHRIRCALDRAHRFAPSTGDVTHRDPVLLLVTANDVLSLAPHPLDLQQLPAESGALPWGPRCALHIIRLVLARNEELAGRLERAVRQLEELPASESPESFFRQTFRLKRVLRS